jgi:outer membrane protein assembly factor BamB
MAAEPQIVAEQPTAPPRRRRWASLRVALAVLIGMVTLPFGWGATLVVSMMTPWPDSLGPIVRVLTSDPFPTYLGMLAVGFAATLLLTLGTVSAFSPGERGSIGAGLIGIWAVALGFLIVKHVGSLIPKVYVGPLLFAATLWVLWAAWIRFWPLRWPVRIGILVLLLAAAAAFPMLLRAEGLTGDGQANFAWRWTARGAGPEGAPDAGATADLTRTGPDDFAQYLGPQRLAVLPDARLARDWSRTPPREVWRRSVGPGWGAFAVVGDYAVTQEQHGPRECVVCYRLADGARVWLHGDDTSYHSPVGVPGPRATPTIASGRVYAVGATGVLNCLDGATGRPLWSVNILEDSQAKDPAFHGVCGSPLVVEDLVIVSPTGKGGPSLAAYHKDTGRPVWKGGADQASYSSPLLADLAGQRQVLLFNVVGVAGHDLATGQVLWNFPWTNKDPTNCSQPIPNAGAPGQVFVGTGYGKGCALFRLERAADGKWTTHTVWEIGNLKTKFTTAVLYGGFLYGLDDGILECVELTTGKRNWKDGRYQHGQVLLAGDLLLVQAENGPVALVEPVPDGLRELGRIPALSSKTWNNPALAGRYLLVRNDQEAPCYELPLRQAE